MSQTKAQLLDGKSATIQFTGGSASAPSVSFTGDTNTGIYSPGADQVAISTGGTGRLFVDANGNVGVGAAPVVVFAGQTHLTVNHSSGGTTVAGINLATDGTRRASLITYPSNSEALRITAESTTLPITVHTNGSERLRITSAGLVGIGTSSPGTVLHCAINSSATSIATAPGTAFFQNLNATPGAINNLLFVNSGGFGSAAIYTTQTQTGNSGDNLVLSTKSSGGAWNTGVVINTAGNAGIGTTSPSSRLHVLNPSAGPEVSIIERDNSGVFLKLYRNAGSGNQGGLIGADSAGTYFAGGTSTAEMLYIDSGNSVMQFFTSGNERARINSSGTLLVGTTTFGNNRRGVSITPASIQIANNSGSAALFLSALNTNVASNIGGVITFDAVYRNSDNDSTQIAYIKGLRENATENAWASYLSFETSPGTTAPVERMRIDSSGRVGIGVTSPGALLHAAGKIRFGSNTNYYGEIDHDAASTGANIYDHSDSGGHIFRNGGQEALRIDGSKRLLVGTSSSSAEAKFIVQGGSTAAGGAINIQRNATTASAGSTIGFINFANSANNVGATISADGDGTWSAGTSHPTRLAFSTTADGASSPTERARLNNLGYLTGTVNGLGNGLYLANQFYRLNSGNVGSNATGAQSVFGAGVNLVADTVYAFESFYVLQKSAGTTSHTVAVSFGGTAGLNNINYGIIWNRDNTAAASSNMTGIAGAYQSFATAASSLVLTSAIASANQTITLKLSGTVSISTAGTFVPQYTLSAAPGGAYTTLAGSYFKIAALGAAGSNISIGSWA